MFNKNAGKTLAERRRRIADFLLSNRAGVLATVDPDGAPHASVIYHTVDENFNVSFLTKSGTEKYDNLLNNNRSVLVVFEASSQTVAQIKGEAVEVTDSRYINAVAASVFMASLRTGRGGLPPVAKLQAGEYAVFRIEPDQIKIASYAHSDLGGYDKIFESLDSSELKNAGSRGSAGI